MNLATRYLGLTLKNPLVAGASPLHHDLDNIRQLEDNGAAAVVLPSIFEEQIESLHSPLEALSALVGAPTREYFPPLAAYRIGPMRYLEFVRRATRAVNIPVIASINGVTDSNWITYARQLERAGAHALELNVSLVPADPLMTGRAVEQRHLNILKSVKDAVRIPVAVKLSPYFSSVGWMALELERAGADGLVLFNRLYEPDIDIARLALTHRPDVNRPADTRLPQLWLGLLSGQVKISLAACTGVETTEDAVKYLLAGADAVMTTSALLRHGPEHIKVLLTGLEQWLASHAFGSIDEVRGRVNRRDVADPAAFERANYIKVLHGYRCDA